MTRRNLECCGGRFQTICAQMRCPEQLNRDSFLSEWMLDSAQVYRQSQRFSFPSSMCRKNRRRKASIRQSPENSFCARS
jgi:hypothetical protein